MNISTFFDANIDNIAKIGLFSLLSFMTAMVLTPIFFTFLRSRMGQSIRDAGPDGKATPLFSKLHKGKAGTPTMGGIIIWGTVLLMVVFSKILAIMGYIDHSLWNRKETYLVLFALVSAGILGMVDDYFNIKKIGKHKGIRVRPKMFWLTVLALMGGFWFFYKLGIDTIHIPGLEYFFPWIGQSDFYLGWLYIPLFVLVFISTTNAVNFTDGLDGLASGLCIFAFGAFGAIAFAEGQFLLSTVCFSLTGALTAFLWWNAYPAKIFMGDTGSLALGAMLGTVAMQLDSLLVLLVIGFVFIVETLSIIIQMLSKKLRNGKKVFLIAPIHHHFEQLGWHEANVVTRFWVVGAVCGLLGMIVGILGTGI